MITQLRYLKRRVTDKRNNRTYIEDVLQYFSLDEWVDVPVVDENEVGDEEK